MQQIDIESQVIVDLRRLVWDGMWQTTSHYTNQIPTESTLDSTGHNNEEITNCCAMPCHIIMVT